MSAVAVLFFCIAFLNNAIPTELLIFTYIIHFLHLGPAVHDVPDKLSISVSATFAQCYNLLYRTPFMNTEQHRRRNGRGHGGHGPFTFQPKLFLKSLLSFLNTILMRKTIHQDEESTNMRRNPS